MIKIQQALWGYSDGHHLLETSTSLSNQVKKVLGPLTDLSGNESPRSFDGYLTGYPLKEEKCYALSKTWYATEMSRPGCVWTHTLFIDYDKVSTLTATKIDQLFRRPINIQDLDAYKVPIILENDDNDTFSSNPRINEIALQLFSFIVQTPSVPIMIAADSTMPFNCALESLISALGISFFNDFSFCTGSFSNRTINRKPLDLQVVPTAVSKLVRRSNRNEVVYIEYPFDNKSINNIESFSNTKEFILYCGKRFYNRTNWVMLSSVFNKVSSEKPFSIDEIITILKDTTNTEDINIVFSKLMQAIYLPSKYHIEKNLESKIEILMDLFTSNCDDLKTNNIAQSIVYSILETLYNNSPKDVINLAVQLSMHNVNQLGKNSIKQISEILTTNDYSLLINQSTIAALLLIPFNPNLVFCEDLWKQDIRTQLLALNQLRDSSCNINPNEFNCTNIIYLIFDTSDYDITSDLYKTFSDHSIDSFFAWYRTDNIRIQKSERWVNLCKYNPTLSIEKLKLTNSPHLFEMVIDVLDPYDETIGEIPIETWELFYKRFCLDYHSRYLNAIYAQFILPIIIKSSNRFTTELTNFAFVTVHNILAHNEMKYTKWDRLSKLLPPDTSRTVWDKCKRLRKAAKIKNLDIDFTSID